MKIAIRKARKKDIKQIVELFRKESYKKPYNERWAQGSAEKKIRTYFRNNTIFVASMRKKIVGFIIGHTFLFHDGLNGFVDEIFVSSEHQGAGIGTNLLKKLESHYKKKGAAAMSLGANEDSKAYEFWTKRGYVYENFKILFKRWRKSK